MGLPEINIEFSGKAKTAVNRSRLGIVVLILKDDTGTFDTMIYKGVDEIKAADWNANNLDYIQKAFEGNPRMVICERIGTEALDYNGALSRLKYKKFNYLAIPEIESSETTSITTWIKTKRDTEKKTFKAVLPNTSADYEGIINFTTSGIVVGEKTYTTAEYTARIAGILAGLPFSRSATYFDLDEVSAITEIEDPDAAVDNGELILINDGEKIKIGRGVNSLKTVSETKNEDFKSIRIIEVQDMIQDDIYSTYNNQYVGKVNNTYDNQVLFVAAINNYFKELANIDILDQNSENKAVINIAKQRLAWESVGTDTTDWDDQEVKETSFKRNVFLAGKIKIVDAMEDLDFDIAI